MISVRVSMYMLNFLCNIVSQNLLCNTRWNYNSSKLVWSVTFHQCKGKNISWIKVQLNWVSVPGQMCKSQILLCDRKKTRGGKTTRIKIQFLNGLHYMPLKFISKSHTHTHTYMEKNVPIHHSLPVTILSLSQYIWLRGMSHLSCY